MRTYAHIINRHHDQAAADFHMAPRTYLLPPQDHPQIHVKNLNRINLHTDKLLKMLWQIHVVTMLPGVDGLGICT